MAFCSRMYLCVILVSIAVFSWKAQADTRVRRELKKENRIGEVKAKRHQASYLETGMQANEGYSENKRMAFSELALSDDDVNEEQPGIWGREAGPDISTKEAEPGSWGKRARLGRWGKPHKMGLWGKRSEPGMWGRRQELEATVPQPKWMARKLKQWLENINRKQWDVKAFLRILKLLQRERWQKRDMVKNEDEAKRTTSPWQNMDTQLNKGLIPEWLIHFIGHDKE